MSQSRKLVHQAGRAIAQNNYYNVRRIADLLGLRLIPTEPGEELFARVNAALRGRWLLGQEIIQDQDTAKIASAVRWDNSYIAWITVELPGRGEVEMRVEDLLKGEAKK